MTNLFSSIASDFVRTVAQAKPVLMANSFPGTAITGTNSKMVPEEME
jgi:hypothetical protein